MKFIDEVKVELRAGRGGDGAITFRREAHVDKGGPNGGDGGNGGDIIFRGDTGLNTLLHLKFKKIIIAKDGENGMRKNMYGADAENTIIKVPFGTLVYEDDQLIADITEDKEYVIAKGGAGGRGNVKFKSAKNKAPRLNEAGARGENKFIRLELQVLADVGFVGLPSAGKSTLLGAISNSAPKIGDYEFTTLTPQLGLVKVGENSFVAADLPGLIKGASLGKGLGDQFLRHIERCRVIAHIIDFGSEEKNPIESYKQINEELRLYDPLLLEREQLIIANKSDLSAFESHLIKFQKKYPELNIVPISSLLRTNLELVKNKLYQLLQRAKPISKKVIDQKLIISFEPDFTITRLDAHNFKISGKKVANIAQRVPLTTNENIMRFNYKLKSLGIWDALLEKGIQNGDMVNVADELELEWNDKVNLW